MKIVKTIQLKIFIFQSHEKSLYIAWACFCNETKVRKTAPLLQVASFFRTFGYGAFGAISSLRPACTLAFDACPTMPQ